MTCACEKRAYPNRAEARLALHHLIGHGGQRRTAERGRTQVYHCDGGVWHVGRAPLQAVVAIRRKRAA